MSWLSPLTRGSHITLEPLSHDHHEDLVEAETDGELWNLWYASVPAPDGVQAESWISHQKTKSAIYHEACNFP
jgi:N-acetyltransferase